MANSWLSSHPRKCAGVAVAPLALDHVPGNAPLNFSEQSLPTFEDVCLLDQPTFEDVCLLDQPTFEDVCLLDQPTFEDVCLLDQPTFEDVCLLDQPTFEDVCLLDQPTFEDVCLLNQPTFEDVCLLDQPTFEDVCLLDQPTLCFIPSKSRPAFAQALSSALKSYSGYPLQHVNLKPFGLWPKAGQPIVILEGCPSTT